MNGGSDFVRKGLKEGMTNREGKWNFSLSNGKAQIVENTGKLAVQKPSGLKRFDQKSSAFSIQQGVVS